MASAALTLDHQGDPITVSIEGIVVDELGEIVPNATVGILHASQSLKNTLTDENGEFSFQDLEVTVNIHAVRVAKARYSAAQEELILTKDFHLTTVTIAIRIDRESREAGSYQISSDKLAFGAVRVLFATDRNRLIARENSDANKMFGNSRSSDGAMSFGACDVSIPEGHKKGKHERPLKVFKFSVNEDPNKHFVVLGIEERDEQAFLSDISSMAEQSPRRDAFVFIHGYFVTFPEAIRRTAQMAVDLQFDGAPICYSWPSSGTYSGYLSDEDSVAWSTPHLLKMLKNIAALKAVSTIHLVAHSMGNRALVKCLEDMAGPHGRRFEQIILAAPDMDAEVFKESAARITPAATRTTLYVSSKDLPLALSRSLRGYPRAGESGKNVLILPNVDTVDVSALPHDIFGHFNVIKHFLSVGHSYFGTSRSVLGDIYELFRNGTPPPRFGVQKSPYADNLWILTP